MGGGLSLFDIEGIPPSLIGNDGVLAALTLCGCSNEQKATLMNEGFTTMADFLVIQSKDVSTMCTNLSRIPVNQGGIKIGTVIMKKLEALIDWCHNREREGLPLDANAFNNDVLVSYVKKAQLEDVGDQYSPEPPKDFKVLKWVSWHRKFESYLWQIKGKNNVPLFYVIRRDRDNQQPFNSEEERQVFAVNHTGSAFRIDNAQVWNELQTIMADTPAWTWISKFETKKDGRSAMKALRDHYDGPGEVEKRISLAKRELQTAHYKSEKVFTFEKYVTKLSKAFQILEENGIPKVEREKVDILLEKMYVDDSKIMAAIANISMTPQKRSNFLMAANELSEYISIVMPFAASVSGKKPARQISEVCQANKKQRPNPKGNEDNGGDISDLGHSLTHQEWKRLSKDPRQKIQAMQKAKKEQRDIKKAVTVNNCTESQDEPVLQGKGGQFGSGAPDRQIDVLKQEAKEKHMEEKLTPMQAEFAKTQYDIFRKDIISTLDRENKAKQNSLDPLLSITHGFNSTNMFQRWYTTFVHQGFGKLDSALDPDTFGFLFAPIYVSKQKEIQLKQAELRSQLGKTWEVKMQQDTTLMKEIGRATGLALADLKINGEGGPTHYFFCRLWNQLGSLAIQLPQPNFDSDDDEDEEEEHEEVNIHLFEFCQGGLLPTTDEMLMGVYPKKMGDNDRETMELQIQGYYRAIGRILAHCMLKSIVVATHVLPDLYKTVLLRGLDIEKEEYPLGLLIDHVGALLDVDCSNKDEPPEMLLGRKLGLIDSDVNESLPLRKKIKEIFLDDRRLSLEYLKEGLTLGGTITWRTIFGWVPTPTVNKLVFGRQDISEEMVFSTTDGSLRFIRFEQDYFDSDKSLHYREVQKRFETRFTEFVRHKMKDDPTFISNFVELCTGSPFLRDIDLNPDFHIRLEYNGSEMEQDFLPVVHTCDNCIKIPAQAYNADIEIFQEKLATVMRLSQTNFDMQ